MVMEALSCILDFAVDHNKFQLHHMRQSPKLTHLLFVDDLLVFSDGHVASLLGISEVLQTFKSLSGLDMNPNKSESYFSGYVVETTKTLNDHWGIRMGSFPTNYLGLLLNSKRLSISALQHFLKKRSQVRFILVIVSLQFQFNRSTNFF